MGRPANCCQLSEHIYAPGVLFLAKGVNGLNAFYCDNEKVTAMVHACEGEDLVLGLDLVQS